MSVDTGSYAEQVRRFVRRHRRHKRLGRLLFAGWYDRDDPSGDVKLFEVFQDFPDPGLGKLETYVFPSSADISTKGVTKLTITSPSELREAAGRGDATLRAIMDSPDKEVIYPEKGDWETFLENLVRGS